MKLKIKNEMVLKISEFSRVERKLSDAYETRSNESSEYHLSPRSSLTSWNSIEKSKHKIIIKSLTREKEELIEKLKVREKEAERLKDDVSHLQEENNALQGAPIKLKLIFKR